MKNNVRYSLNLILGISFLFSIANAYAQISTTELDRIFASDAAQGDGSGMPSMLTVIGPSSGHASTMMVAMALVPPMSI